MLNEVNFPNLVREGSDEPEPRIEMHPGMRSYSVSNTISKCYDEKKKAKGGPFFSEVTGFHSFKF